MVLLAGFLGLRVSEVVALKWDDLNEAAGTIAIERSFTRGRLDGTKTRASNAILPVDEILMAILAAWRSRTDNSEWLFPSRRTGGPQSASMLREKKVPFAPPPGTTRVGEPMPSDEFGGRHQ
jgi:integrase